jgi:pimeloyl-ACP methyl ester carboxylesterase
MVEDLHTLLVNANIPGPYVLVAHSMAGFTSRLYADQYPQEVVGMVWVDITHPDGLADELSLLPPESPDEPSVIRNYRQWLVALRDDPMQIAEQWDYETSAVQVRATGSLGSIPLVVLTRDVTDSSWWKKVFGYGFPLELAESLDQSHLPRQEELAELSSNSTHIIVKDSGHIIPIDQPDAVVDAIKSVVESVRGE